MNLVQPGAAPIKFVSSAENESPADKDLLSVVYRRAEKASPEFDTLFEGINQSIDIRISTFVFRAAPEPVLNLYDFIMTTFVPQPTGGAAKNIDNQLHEVVQQPQPETRDSGKISVIVKLASVQGRWLSISL
jgi:vacuolar protein sorting-associated protein 13A/C